MSKGRLIGSEGPEFGKGPGGRQLCQDVKKNRLEPNRTWTPIARFFLARALAPSCGTSKNCKSKRIAQRAQESFHRLGTSISELMPFHILFASALESFPGGGKNKRRARHRVAL